MSVSATSGCGPVNGNSRSETRSPRAVVAGAVFSITPAAVAKPEVRRRAGRRRGRRLDVAARIDDADRAAGVSVFAIAKLRRENRPSVSIGCRTRRS